MESFATDWQIKYDVLGLIKNKSRGSKLSCRHLIRSLKSFRRIGLFGLRTWRNFKKLVDASRIFAQALKSIMFFSILGQELSSHVILKVP
jgi:hypothetical protein